MTTDTPLPETPEDVPAIAPARRRRLWRWMLGGTLGVFVFLNIMACVHVRAFTRFTDTGRRTAHPEQLSAGEKLKVFFTGVTLPKPSHRRAADSTGLAVEKSFVATSDALKLELWHVPQDAPRFQVVMFHGYAKTASQLLETAGALHELGGEVWMVNFRACGESEGNLSTIGWQEARDVEAGWRHVADQRDGPIILYGFSMGAAAVVHAAGRGGARPDAIIIEGCYDSLLNTIRNRFRMVGLPPIGLAEMLTLWGGAVCGFNAFALNPEDFARNIRVPALVLHGDRDTRARLADGRRVYEALAGPKIFHESKGIGHRFLAKWQPDEFAGVVRELLRVCEGGQTSPPHPD